jgi:hypothetical protein
MKNTLLYLLLISFLLQRCYSYRAIDLKQTPLVIGKDYKIKQEGKFVKATLLSLNDSTTIFLVGKKEKHFPIAAIKEIKIQKFSVVKTVSLIPIVYVGIGVVYVVYALSEWGSN